MSHFARSPGVLLSVRWGEQELAREFLPLATPRAFTIGSAPGCDFSCGGARAFRLLEIDSAGATLGQKGGERTVLERGQPARLVLGPLSFEAELREAPPRVGAGAPTELTTVNVGLVLLAAFGFFAVAAANSDAEGAGLDDELSGAPARAVKVLMTRDTARQASASAAAPRQNKERPQPQASHQARQLPPARPAGHGTAPKLDVGSLFRGPGSASVFAPGGLGADLRAASTGLRTAEAGNGIGLLGSGHGLDGNGLGGMGLVGIGGLGTRGGRGPNNAYGAGVILQPGEKPPPPKFDDPLVEGCALDGTGCLDKELIRRVIRQNLAGFRFCYESLLNRFPNLEGRVSIRFSISQSGRVPSASVASSTAANADLEQCVSGRTQLLQFPSRKWNGMVVVTYPFIFKQSGK